eukprot:GHVT01090797.1.p1 GENE.GHVT01090797.1~~GHVT01090797.1.p1  ORF type:complete len:243 (+),score=14.82 GHVT01090797.1:931-1659(+)
MEGENNEILDAFGCALPKRSMSHSEDSNNEQNETISLDKTALKHFTPKFRTSVTDMTTFYEKLLGRDWEEQLQDLEEEQVPDVPPGAVAEAHNGLDDLLEAERVATAHGHMRQRIRRREAPQCDISDQVADVLYYGEEGFQPLVTENDIRRIRRTAWHPQGINLPELSTIEMGYREAWDIGKQGCIGLLLTSIWDTPLGPNRMRFFVMDGTDPGIKTLFPTNLPKIIITLANAVHQQKRMIM